jgi:hypothetical protein
MNNTHTTKYLTRGCLALALALSSSFLTGCADDEPRSVTTSQTTETTEVVQPGVGAATTTETRTYERQ